MCSAPMRLRGPMASRMRTARPGRGLGPAGTSRPPAGPSPSSQAERADGQHPSGPQPGPARVLGSLDHVLRPVGTPLVQLQCHGPGTGVTGGTEPDWSSTGTGRGVRRGLLDLRQRTDRRAVDHGPVHVEARAVARAVPGPFGSVPRHDAPQVRAVRRAAMERSVVAAERRRDLADAVPHDRAPNPRSISSSLATSPPVTRVGIVSGRPRRLHGGSAESRAG